MSMKTSPFCETSNGNTMQTIQTILEIWKEYDVSSVLITYEAKLDGIKMLAWSSHNVGLNQKPSYRLAELKEELKKLALEKFAFYLGDIGRYKGEDGIIEVTLRDGGIHMVRRTNKTFTKKQWDTFELQLSKREMLTMEMISGFYVKMGGDKNRRTIMCKGPCVVSDENEKDLSFIFDSLNKIGAQFKMVESDEIHYQMESLNGNTLTVDFIRHYHETTYDVALDEITINE